ncbi:MAG TPA: hypothetical protein PLQ23_14845 [Dermatophilaceae bacterium]|nr:hypothetical protein [Dermatophilaceae bacterium]
MTLRDEDRRFVKVSIRQHRHTKFRGIGGDAIALWHGGLQVSKDDGTDGFIARTVPAAVCAFAGITKVKQAIAALVRAGLWKEVEDGWQMYGYLDHQTSAADDAAKRAANSERVRKFRGQKPTTRNALQEPLRNAEHNASRTPSVTLPRRLDIDSSIDDNKRVLFSTGPSESDVERPDPERPAPDVSSSSEQKTADDLVKQVCRELATRALAGRPDVENPEAWHTTTRRNLHAEKGQDIAAFAAANPGLDAVAIADHFEAKTSAARPSKPSDPIEATARARARLDAENDAKRAADAAAKHDRQCEFERRWALLSEAEQHAVTAQAKASVPERLKGRSGPEQAALQAAVLAIPADRFMPERAQPNQEQEMELQEARA